MRRYHCRPKVPHSTLHAMQRVETSFTDTAAVLGPGTLRLFGLQLLKAQGVEDDTVSSASVFPGYYISSDQAFERNKSQSWQTWIDGTIGAWYGLWKAPTVLADDSYDGEVP